jgi:tetratricopeptide (TPR) repeat protein
MILPVLLLLAAGPDQLFQAGQQAYAAEDYEKAMDLFEQAIQASPKTARYHLWYGRACGRRAERVVFFRALGLAKKVASSFEKAVELDPQSVEALNDLLEFYLAAPGIAGGGAEKAPPLAARLAAISPAEGHRAQALIFAKKKDWETAEREYRRALELEPDKLGRLLELASFLAQRGRQDEADALFDRAARLAPDSPEYLFARGKQLALAKRHPQQARALLEQYLKSPRKPDDPPRSEVESLLKKLG